MLSPKKIYNGKTLRQINSELKEITKRDQDVRMKAHFAVGEGASAEGLEEIQEEMTAIGEYNQAYVSDLLDNYGWAGGLSLGAFDAIWLTIMHGPLEMLEKYYPMMEERSKRGFQRIADTTLLQSQDRILIYKGERQLYGTQFVTITSKDGTRQSYVWPIDDLENINERRIHEKALFGKTSWKQNFEEHLESHPWLIFDPDLTIEHPVRMMAEAEAFDAENND